MPRWLLGCYQRWGIAGRKRARRRIDVNLDELLQAGGPERLFRSRSAGSLDWTELLPELLLPLAVRIKGMAHSSLIVWVHAVRIHSLTQYSCLHNAMGAEYF